MTKFTSQQQRIVDRIRSLHQDRQPLNISAVRRHHPKLLDQVMTLKHFRGWRKAIEAAGLSYKKIRVELLDYCVCAVCGAHLNALTAHIRAKHKLTKARYQQRFPGEAPVQSTNLLA